MKAIAKTKAEKGLWIVDVETPSIGPNDVLIKIRRGSICGTDLHIFEWDDWAQSTLQLPLVIGHEFCGVIAKLGSEVSGFKMGDRVSAEGHLTCGHCRNCRAGRRHLCRATIGIGVQRAGAFAEYISIPAQNVFALPDDIPDDVGAILDPLGNAIHSALSFDLVGEDILITGAGPIGIMAVSICRQVGARHIVITDINDYRLNLAKEMGATRIVNIKREKLAPIMEELGMKEGFDIGLEMSGNPAGLRDMLTCMHHGGHIALLGIPPHDSVVDWNPVIFKGLTLKGIYGREIYETWYRMTTLLQSGLKIKPVITHHLPWTDYQRGFELLKSGNAGKVILEW